MMVNLNDGYIERRRGASKLELNCRQDRMNKKAEECSNRYNVRYKGHIMKN